MVPVRRHAGHWRAYLAGGGVVLIALRLLLERKKPEADRNTDQAADRDHDPSKPKPPSYAHRHYDHPSEEEHRTQEQLSWRNSYALNVGIAVVAVLTLGAAGGTYLEARRQAIAAESTLAEMRSEERAWIGPPKPGRVVSDDKKTVSFRLTFQNTGKEPTGQIFVSAYIVSYEDRLSSEITQCRYGLNKSKQGLDPASIVLGGDLTPPEKDNPFIKTTFSKGPKGWLPQSAGAVPNPSIVGCITYAIRPGYNPEFRTTGFGIRLLPGNDGPIMDTTFAMSPT